MRSKLLLAAAVLAIVDAANAQSWKEYSYQDAGFAALFPSEPKIEAHDYATALGAGVKERVYAADSGGVLYTIGIADFTKTRADKNRAIDEAADGLIKLGKLTHDESGRIDGNYGREIRVEDKDGNSYTDAIFYVDRKLYQIKVYYPVKNSDPMGSSGIGFFQTAFRFVY